MAERPWVTPAEVIAYSDYKQVQQRAEEKLLVDISRAEQYVISYTKNNFEDYTDIPKSVKTAVVLLAEAYAYNSCADTNSGGRRVQSETFDDYSCTYGDGAYFEINSVDVKALLDDYVKKEPRNGVTLRMRKI